MVSVLEVYYRKHSIDAASNSGLLLRFSIDAGVTYYNDKDLSRTVSLDRSSPRQKLNVPRDCDPVRGQFGKFSTVYLLDETNNFETCFNSKVVLLSKCLLSVCPTRLRGRR